MYKYDIIVHIIKNYVGFWYFNELCHNHEEVFNEI